MTDQLRIEHEALRGKAKEGRKAFAKSPDSAFVKAMRAAMGEYHQMREQGVEREDACRGLEAILREHWPKPTSKFDANCNECEDTGWVERLCWADVRCGRKWCELASSAHQHRYVAPCYCQVGQTRVKPSVTVETVIESVGKTRKKSGGWRQLGS